VKRLLAVLFILLLGVPAVAAPENPWADSPGARDYPGASAIVLEDNIKAVIHADGTHDLIEYDAIKLLDKDAMERFGRTTRTYDASTETLEVELARLWRPDGRLVEVPARSITDGVPPALARHPLYARMHTLTIEYPEVVEGAVVEFRFKHHRKVPWPSRKFWEVSYTQDYDPILDTRFTFVSPESLPFELATPGSADLAPAEMKRSNGMLEMSWHLEKRPTIPQQPAMPPLRQLASQIQVSNFASWDDFATWARTLYDQAANPTTTVNLKAAASLQGAQGDEARIRALMAWMAKEKPAAGGEVSIEELAPFPAAELLDAPSLLPQDQAVLLLSLLRASGVKAYPALIASADYGDAERGVPSLAQFNHLLIAAPVTDGWLWIDPAGPIPGVLGQGLIGRAALILDGGPARFVSTPIPPPQANREEIQGVARLDPDASMDVALKIREFGANAVAWESMLGSLEEREQKNLMQMMASGINPSSVLRDFFYSKPDEKDPAAPVELSVGFEASQGAEREKTGEYTLHIPILPQRRLASYADTPTAERLYPVVLCATTYEERRLQIVIPDEWKVKSLPKNVTLNNETGSFQVDVRNEGRSVWYYSRLIVRRPEVPLRDYAQFKALMDQVKASSDEVVTLSAGKPAAGPGAPPQ